ncbi:MAG: ABC transporter substrate-binding protein [Vallitalea sp.]|jgi:NitT/TauT family transport system substrate-binding protein|nr:ABC transporter substrate-binding protein [Vallitalea sp.]
MKNKRWILLVTAMLAIVTTLAACHTGGVTQNDKETVKIAYLPITHAVPLFVEQELFQDDFKNVDLELVKFSSWADILDALNTGDVQGASILVELALKAKEQGANIKTVALGHREGNVVIVSDEINYVDDLIGKSFAIPHVNSAHNILTYKMLTNAGFNLDEMNIISMPPGKMPKALVSGEIAGYCVAEPFGSRSVVTGNGKVLFKSSELWSNSVCCSLVLSDEFINNNHDAAQELVNKYLIAGEKVQQEDEEDKEIKEIVKKYLNVSNEELDLSLQWTSYENLTFNRADYDNMIYYMNKMKLLNNPPTYEDFVDNSFIENISK